MHDRIRQLLLIGGATLILAAITEQWVAGLPAGSQRHHGGHSLDEPPPLGPPMSRPRYRRCDGGPPLKPACGGEIGYWRLTASRCWSYTNFSGCVDNSRAGDSLEYTVLHGTQTRIVPLRLEGRLPIWVKLLCTRLRLVSFLGGRIRLLEAPKGFRALTFFLMCLPFALIFSEVNFAAVTQGDFSGRSALTSNVIVGALLFLLFPPLLYLPLIFPSPVPWWKSIRDPGVVLRTAGSDRRLGCWSAPPIGLEQKIPNLILVAQVLIEFAQRRRRWLSL